jgi:uncharacterized protein (TIGR02266 family)
MTQARNATGATAPLDDGDVAEFSQLHDAPPSVTNQAIAMNQRRAAPRYKVELDVSLGGDHNFYVGFVENMSAGGVFIATHMLKAIGDLFELAVHLPNTGDIIRGLGEVRWIREYSESSNVPPGMGVRFVRLEPGCQERIDEFLQQREPLFYDD